MGQTLTDIILLAGATAWVTTALVAKSGPFGLLIKFRHLLSRLLGGQDKSPLQCFHCTSFWVGLFFISAFVTGDELMRALIQFFGVLGIAQALRGQSGEWN
jgi:hypothetical protein